MATKKFDGNGITIKVGESSTAAAGVNTITIPGWKRGTFNADDLSTTGFIPKIAAALKESNAFTVNVDFLDQAAFSGAADNDKFTLTFPGSHGSLVLYGTVTGVGDSSFKNGENPTVDVEITPTHLTSAGAKTDPVLTIS